MTYANDTRAERTAAQQRRNDAEAVLSHPPTVRFLARLLADLGHGSPAYAGDTNPTFYALGRQDAGNKVIDMLREANDRAHIMLLVAAANEREQFANTKPTEETYDED